MLGEDQALTTLGQVSKLYSIPLSQYEIPHWESELAITVHPKTRLGRYTSQDQDQEKLLQKPNTTLAPKAV